MMKRFLILFIAAVTLMGCRDVGKGFRLEVSKHSISWMNGMIGFTTDRDSKGKRTDYPGFHASVRCSNGRTIQMPSDKYSLGYGASFPMGTSGIYAPMNGYSNAEILIETQDRMVIHLQHDPMTILNVPVTLDKQITLYKDSPIMAVTDYYTGDFELLNIAAGLSAAHGGTVTELDEGYAVEYPDGVTAIIIMPQLEQKKYKELQGCVFVSKGIGSDEPLYYYVGISDKGLEHLLEEVSKIL
jgi:hypothetical protein